MSSSILSVRVNAFEREMLVAAAEQAHASLSDFVRRKALEAAEMAVMERRAITIPAEDWERFEAWTESPAVEIPALKELVNRRPTWQK
ncbi:MAG: DUF1778 domain-containing protein [Gammaproteobacteria bacterium]|nr:DUF1778 domain-containing protein [Gammaproteobacteria bacterium]MBU1654540.1 DUF1778 domain-containing protein [Gammaproteobacteria bacterium]MBU1961931.1 DUF1778 domain-containing protein [Gammaproteobacteria bacterium]